MALRIPPEVQREIEEHGASAYPYEGCGLLLGRQSHNGRDKVVSSIFPVENRWEVEEEKVVRFQIAPQDMLQAELAAMREGLDIVGVFHSHPDHEPVASPRDLEWATWPGYSYLITEIRDGAPGRSRSWQLTSDRSGFVEEEVTVAAKS